MKYKRLGNSGLKVSELCLGVMNFGSVTVGGSTDEEAWGCMEAFVDAGGNFFDTANMYHYGHSTELLGDFIKSERDRFVVASKCTFRPHPLQVLTPNDPNGAGNNRKYMRRAVEAELKRLGTDYLDVLYLHSWDFSVPVHEVMSTMNDLVREGKVLYLGATNVPAYIVTEANLLAQQHGWEQFSACEGQYSLMSRTIERELMPMCDRFGMSITVYEGLAGGLFCGNEEEIRMRFNGQAYKVPSESDWKLIAEVTKIANKLGVSVPQVALAWIRAQGSNLIPIIGGRVKEHVIDNIGCLDVVLPEEDLAKLAELTDYTLGYPNDMIKACDAWVYNGQLKNIEMPLPGWYSHKTTVVNIATSTEK